MESLELWLTQDIWLLIGNPRLVCSDTSSYNILLNVICIFVCGRFLFLTSVILHLISEKVTSYWFDHVPIFIMSLFNVDFIMILSLDFLRTDESSAKIVMSDSIFSGISLIYIKKSSDPSIKGDTCHDRFRRRCTPI